jgi:hypothetical protein
VRRDRRCLGERTAFRGQALPVALLRRSAAAQRQTSATPLCKAVAAEPRLVEEQLGGPQVRAAAAALLSPRTALPGSFRLGC